MDLIMFLCLTACLIIGLIQNNIIKKIKHSNEYYKEKNEKLEYAYRTKSMYVSRLSHDIRTEMSSIIGFTSISRQLCGENRYATEYLDKITVSSKKLLCIMDDVLDMSTMEVEQLNMAIAPFDVTKLLTTLSAAFAQQCKSKGVEFVLELGTFTPTILVGDCTRISQVINNLLACLLKNSNKNDRIILSAMENFVSDNNSVINLSISNCGAALSEQEHSTLIETKHYDGMLDLKRGESGLSLSITQKLVELMGAKLEVFNEEELGTRFLVTLYLEHTNYKTQDKIEKSSALNVLVVDRSTSNCEYMAEALERIGTNYTCISSRDKLQGYVKSKTHYDICFVDSDLPILDGTTPIKRIRSSFPDDSIIVAMSHENTKENRDKAREEGANLFITKPISQSVIFNIIMTIGHENVIADDKNYDKLSYHKKRVLLVENNDWNLDVAMHMLESVGVKVECATDGEQAVAMYAANPDNYYHLILMNTRMPKCDGFEATKRMRGMGRNRQIPIIAVSADCFSEDFADIFASGMNDYIVKPFESTAFYQVLDKYLGNEEDYA